MNFEIIKDVKIKKLKKFSDVRGSVLRMIKSGSKKIDSIGEVYFSTINKGKVKAWTKHLEMKSNIVCVSGSVQIVMFDNREIKKNKLMQINLSRKNYYLVTIPKLIWYGFKNISKNESIICNCSSIPFDKNEVLKKKINDKEIPFKWK